MSRRTAVPFQPSGTPSLDRVLEALASNVNGITGQEKNATRLVKVPASGATNDQLAALLNALVDRVQGTAT